MSGDDAPRARRLLYLTDDLGGGSGNHLLSLAEYCHDVGWNVEVFSFAPRTARRKPDLPVRQLPELGGPSAYPFHQAARFLQVRRLIRDREPDLVHAYFFWPIVYSRLLKLSGSLPVLVENREDEGFNWGMHEYSWLRATRGMPDRIVCVSRAVRRCVSEQENVERERTTVIHNGVEEPRDVDPASVAELRSELGIMRDASVVGMVANLNRAVKGVGRLLAAVPAILAEVPGAHFLVVGEGGRRAILERKASELGVSGAVHFVGYREDVDVFYRLMDISVLTSSTEGLSITLLESMSHGLPVVATRVGGNPEIVDDGSTGFLVPLEHRDRFTDCVVRLLRDEGLRRQMGDAARKKVRRRFSLVDTVRRYEQLYRTLIDARTG